MIFKIFCTILIVFFTIPSPGVPLKASSFPLYRPFPYLPSLLYFPVHFLPFSSCDNKNAFHYHFFVGVCILYLLFIWLYPCCVQIFIICVCIYYNIYAFIFCTSVGIFIYFLTSFQFVNLMITKIIIKISLKSQILFILIKLFIPKLLLDSNNIGIPVLNSIILRLTL